jgi:hypothetical protein
VAIFMRSGVPRLLRLDFRRHRRLVEIHNGLDEDRSGSGERLRDHLTTLFRIGNAEALTAARVRESGKVDRMQIARELGVAEEDHLLPFDHSQGVVLCAQTKTPALVSNGRASIARPIGIWAYCEHCRWENAGGDNSAARKAKTNQAAAWAVPQPEMVSVNVPSAPLTCGPQAHASTGESHQSAVFTLLGQG